MKSVMAVSCLGFAQAFTPGIAPNRFAVRRVAETTTQLPASYLSSIEDDSNKAPAWKEYQEELKGTTQQGINPDGNYEGLVDGDGFDGGDGQVGVVGDGGNAMESFDNRESIDHGEGRVRQHAPMIGGVEAKKMQKNAFGSTTGYADALAEAGMVELDEYGDDRLQARRQQLENWRNQRELMAQQNSGLQEMADYTGVEYDARRATQSYFNALDKGKPLDDAKWNVYQGEAKDAALTEAATGLAAGDVLETVAMTSAFPSPSFHTIKVENDVISYEDFVVGFSAESDNGGADFQVTPLSGELNRRGGDPTELNVVFKPTAPGGAPRVAYMVVKTEESNFTYKLVGTVM